MREIQFLERFGALVVAIRRDGVLKRTHLGKETLFEGDDLLALGPQHAIYALSGEPDFDTREQGMQALRDLADDLRLIGIPEGSSLVGATMAGAR